MFVDEDLSGVSGLRILGIDGAAARGESIELRSPIGEGIVSGAIRHATALNLSAAITAAGDAFSQWRQVPAPLRGVFVREIAAEVRANHASLAALITLEAGKTHAEAVGEVQEWIDVCEFAVGLSRQLHGLTIASERPDHRMMEQWHPLGTVGVISAFNFPMAVWAWNAMLAFVCGNAVVWKPSEKTPLCALGVARVVEAAASRCDSVPVGLSSVVVAGADIGAALAGDPRVPLISATGSVPMGRSVAATVGARLGRTLLELGGNNAMIVRADADLELAVRAIVFSAVGTAGQRCTSLRRLIVHSDIADELLRRLQSAYKTLPIGDPRDESTLVGPLVDQGAWEAMQRALVVAEEQGGRIVFGGERCMSGVPAGGFYPRPAIVEAPPNAAIVLQETFAPILYVCRVDDLDEAIRVQNMASEGLSSAIFTESMREAEYFLSACGSDCGIANVNIGTSGAEIGGAFGGEKDTGGGRESGSDAWKGYMRRATNTVNYGAALPLSQGIRFGPGD